ncbi:hypothetical protein [Chryseobacterium sp. HSC-36S06]|uniref:hypothetical protein n=1 Tax=Chryseobacterium sp. HSC-36S06 TaxID=2910970 RepID=UPI00209D459D|nr:hypothetical protein [Chryseobacterium sp. HSC-36S06]MCP2037159.1 hypothetical protein [Chryseobacterium sp. HSC-36S06]
MKINILAPAILVSVSGQISMSCTANLLPKVTEPTYQTYDSAGEKGYYVSFGLSHDSIPATSIVINRIQQKISADDKVGLKYKVNVISQSRKILGFKPMITDKENGIFFRSDTAEIFKPVDFKLRQK